MRVVVTGSEGFVGQYICKKYLDEEHDVYGIDNWEKYGDAPRVHSGYYSFCRIKGDLRDWETTKNIFSYLTEDNEDIDLLICCASDVGGIKRLSNYSNSDILDNLTIDNNTISAANRVGVKKIVYLSSSSIYSIYDELPYEEGDNFEVKFCSDLLSPYAKYKWQTEETLQTLNDIPYVIFRLFNAAGVGDEGEHPHVIADFVRRAKYFPDFPFDIYGDGKQTRNFIHGEDIADCIYRSYYVSNEVLNLGAEGNNTSMLSLAEDI